MKILLLVIVLSSIGLANAWLSTGHLTTATVAYNELKKNNPEVLARAEAILEPLRQFFMEPNYPFISAAEWPDDIKGQGWKNFNILHFLDKPVIAPDFHGTATSPVDNATFAFNECSNVLTNGKGEMSIIGKSMCMRLMIHIVGDIHQPLHTASLFSAQFPDGDMGGNLFEIIYPPKKYKELHAYWDDTAHKYSSSIQVPLDEKNYAKLQEIATGVTKKWPRESLTKELSLKTFDEWTEESGKLAYEYAYDRFRLHSGDTISDEYDAKAKELVDHQLALGGYRLADALTSILKSKEPKGVVEELIERIL